MKPYTIAVVGIGPGDRESMTLKALHTIEAADTIVGYSTYLKLIEDLLEGKEVVQSGMTEEIQRCEEAIALALQGKQVAVVSSGDAGVYGMASLILELAAAHKELTVEVVPGVTAALSGAALLGSPLTLDFACISLSDLLVPWEPRGFGYGGGHLQSGQPKPQGLPPAGGGNLPRGAQGRHALCDYA